STSGLLLQICLCGFLIWYLRLLWSRRRLYELASKMPGPFSLPLIGSALFFAGNVNDWFSNVMALFRTYSGLFRIWFGPKLLVIVSDPKYFEILLPNCLQKQFMYSVAEPLVGHGLVTAPYSKIAQVVREKKKAYKEKIAENNGHLNENSQEHVSNRKAFLDYLIEVTSEGSSKFTSQELADEVTTFIIAGSDTTASTTSFAFITLGIHQDLQQKVYDEVIEVVGPTRPVEPADLPHLKYTERFIKEALRLFPVATMIFRDIDEDVSVGDYVIPGGATVVFGILWAHTDEKYWPEPYKFDPDRFLPEEDSKRPRCAYVPFSYGSRNCIGMKYAMMVMKALIVTVVRKYRISTSYKNVEDVFAWKY
ncbi:hypothetical protein NQ318_005770, partial [Aromia moschata]